MIDHYTTYLGALKEVIVKIGNQYDNILSVEPENWQCRETYPCSGHGRCVITMKDNTQLKISTDSIGKGLIMWYLSKGSDHFTEYVDTEMKQFICKELGYDEVSRYSPILKIDTSITTPPTFCISRLHPISGVPEIIQLKILNTSLQALCTRIYCDLCQSPHAIKNPIYTNEYYKGVDLCTECIRRALGMRVKPVLIENRQVFSLHDIENCQ